MEGNVLGRKREIRYRSQIFSQGTQEIESGLLETKKGNKIN